ncbi:hypothetical protein NE865_06561 [Phthorimaea operculella]|nr:hypothetical protein NE865_06561 [Phthorimaea operculella]
MLSIIEAYAPTAASSEPEIQAFYDSLTMALHNSSDDTLIIGDFNAKIGQPQPEDGKALGKWGYGDRNERGDMLLNFCLENQLYISNTFFKKKQKQRWTWLSPDGATRNERLYPHKEY